MIKIKKMPAVFKRPASPESGKGSVASGSVCWPTRAVIHAVRVPDEIGCTIQFLPRQIEFPIIFAGPVKETLAED
jgi:hypothetical protein